MRGVVRGGVVLGALGVGVLGVGVAVAAVGSSVWLGVAAGPVGARCSLVGRSASGESSPPGGGSTGVGEVSTGGRISAGAGRAGVSVGAAATMSIRWAGGLSAAST